MGKLSRPQPRRITVRKTLTKYWDDKLKLSPLLIFQDYSVYLVGDRIPGIPNGSLYWTPLYNERFYWYNDTDNGKDIGKCYSNNNFSYLGILPKSYRSQREPNAIWLTPEQYEVLKSIYPTLPNLPKLEEIEKIIQNINDILLYL